MKAYLHETKPQVMQEGGLFISMTEVVSIGREVIRIIIEPKNMQVMQEGGLFINMQ